MPLTPMSYAQKTVAFIGAASSWRHQLYGMEYGPQALCDAGLLNELISSNIVTIWAENIRPLYQASEMAMSCGRTTFPLMTCHAEKLANAIKRTLQKNYFPVVIGGDQSLSTGTWGAITTTLGLQKNFGLLWIDAHIDAHLPQTQVSDTYRNVPIAALLGYGDQKLIDIAGPGAKLNPEHIILIGTRSFQQHDAEFLRKLGVRIYDMNEIQTRGFQAVLQEALNRITILTQGFGVSIDIDAFDPSEAPGVSMPEANGLLECHVLNTLHHLRAAPQFKGLEITEYNPHFDQDGKTAQLIIRLLKELLPR